MNDRICYIVGAGDAPVRLEMPRKGFLIAADGGYKTVQGFGAAPDLVLGDFDSLGYVPKYPALIRTPAEKDDTDMMLAVREGMKRGFRRFVLYGALGGERLDHTLANMQTLLYLTLRGCAGLLIGRRENITAVHDGELAFSEKSKGYVSVFALDDVSHGVTLQGLKYPLNDVELPNNPPLGVSNEFLGKPSRISVREGTLAVLWSGDPFQTLEGWL